MAIAVIIAAFWFSGGQNNGPTNNTDLIAPQHPIAAAIPVAGLTLGNPQAAVTLDVWGDFQCPLCQNFALNVEPTVITNYVATGKVKVVWHDWLVIDLNHPGTHESLDAANAARCAADQNQFWSFHDWLYTNQYAEVSGAFTSPRLKALGAAAGLESTKFNTCVDSGAHNAEVQAQSAQPPAGASGTPSLLVNGELLADSFTPTTINAALDKALGVTPSPGTSTTASAGTSGGATASPASSAPVSPSTSPAVKPS
jgi:protein-disulfide isomerase